jgi:hypothetical protein
MRSARLAPLLALVLLAGGLTGCTSFPTTNAVCVPRLVITPAVAHAGQTVEVATSHACDLQPPKPGWDVVVHPSDRTSPRAEVHVMPGEDGSFTASLTLPADMPAGSAVATIANYWDVAPCDDHASCAASAATFTVAGG